MLWNMEYAQRLTTSPPAPYVARTTRRQHHWTPCREALLADTVSVSVSAGVQQCH